MQEMAGAAGYQGQTYHYDIDGNGQIDTSITFTGISAEDLNVVEAYQTAGSTTFNQVDHVSFYFEG